MKKRIVPLLMALILLSVPAAFPLAETMTVPPAEETAAADAESGTGDAYVQLLGHLLQACEHPDGQDALRIREDIALIGQRSGQDPALARSIAEQWQKVYLDPGNVLHLYGGGETAEELEDAGIPQGTGHAFVVLGYELQDGMMTEELTGRCRAAAAAARSYPDSVLIMTGGATGPNNPEGHTEAGLMKQYLTETCGIAEDRIITDEEAMTTAENALYTFGILQEMGIQTLTLVTSSYHQRWAQVLYNAVGEIYRLRTGSAARIVADYCWPAEPSRPAYRQDHRIALMQLAGILGLPGTALREIIGY